MNMRILVKEKDRLDIELDQIDMTLLHPLVEELLKDKVVTEAQYIVGHPELDKPVLRVRVSSGKPDTPVKKAAKKLAGDFGELRTLLGNKAK
jgi:DNA-directed RNA polymerase subunit L